MQINSYFSLYFHFLLTFLYSFIIIMVTFYMTDGLTQATAVKCERIHADRLGNSVTALDCPFCFGTEKGVML